VGAGDDTTGAGADSVGVGAGSTGVGADSVEVGVDSTGAGTDSVLLVEVSVGAGTASIEAVVSSVDDSPDGVVSAGVAVSPEAILDSLVLLVVVVGALSIVVTSIELELGAVLGPDEVLVAGIDLHSPASVDIRPFATNIQTGWLVTRS
jgi:hypothetical protein